MARIPAIYDFDIDKATDWDETYTFHSNTDPDNETLVPLDLTGATVEGTAWDFEREHKYADFNVTYINKSTGKVKLNLTDTQTVNFPDELHYDIVVINSNGERNKYFQGKITVKQTYTRATT